MQYWQESVVSEPHAVPGLGGEDGQLLPLATLEHNHVVDASPHGFGEQMQHSDPV